MLSNNPNQRMEFQDRPVTPVLTGLLIVLCFVAYACEKGVLQPGATMGGWLFANCYQLSSALVAIQEKNDWSYLIIKSYATNFSAFHIVQTALNCYFFWVFGKQVEMKLGPIRYAVLLLIGLLVPMFVLFFDTKYFNNEMRFVGAPFLICTLLGTYMVFPPIPKSKIGQGQTQRPKNEIFRKGGRPDPLDKYIGNPWMFVLTFGLIQGAFHFWLTLPQKFWIFEGLGGYDNLIASPMIVGGLLGWTLGYLLEQQATAGLKESPMTLMAVKRYHELLDLDVSHDEAIRGTARTLGLPYDKVKEWVAKNKGSMRIK
jgi:membrane associated rhomboid family serine protease